MKIEIELTGLTHDGRGVGVLSGKKVFVAGGLPKERVLAQIVNREASFDEAELIEVLHPSPERVSPQCALYGVCGGCQLQHLSPEGQREWKMRNFIQPLLSAVQPKQCEVVPPLVGEAYGYRRRAKWVLARDAVDKAQKLGFRRLHSTRLVDVPSCPVLTESMNSVLAEVRPNLIPLASRKERTCVEVAADNGVFWQGEEELPLTQMDAQPYYRLQDLQLFFQPSEFVQVNALVNQKMVVQALEWLQLKKSDKVLDLFCGIGNFTLPLAKDAGTVVGVEGLADLVTQAHKNAQINQLHEVAFYQADLFAEDFQYAPWFKAQQYDAILLDPGRPGAKQVCEVLGQLQAQRIVYVSCHVATLIRDVKILAQQGYELVKAGMVDMFPQTYHTEAMVLLQKRKAKKPRPNKRIFRM